MYNIYTNNISYVLLSSSQSKTARSAQLTSVPSVLPSLSVLAKAFQSSAAVYVSSPSVCSTYPSHLLPETKASRHTWCKLKEGTLKYSKLKTGLSFNISEWSSSTSFLLYCIKKTLTSLSPMHSSRVPPPRMIDLLLQSRKCSIWEGATESLANLPRLQTFAQKSHGFDLGFAFRVLGLDLGFPCLGYQCWI